MRIHSLTVQNFRGIERLEMADLPDTGVIVIHGCNEAGKSTITDAIDLVLRERHSSKKKEVKACAPVGRDVGPEVELTATVGRPPSPSTSAG
ncbi:AAA family ATPase [Corynebacterium aquatimens]|uniref:AAA family ATPase n=1 Tax=Corynebacterium aquatimens TaxID=1190508 RepID=UPI002540DE92|nr:AAA family ATPase [Corynebacterium aquatimens]QYH19904.1 AAA family ATPase [Corynebacterium aquatimens]